MVAVYWLEVTSSTGSSSTAFGRDTVLPMVKIEEPDANNSHGSVRGLELPVVWNLASNFARACEIDLKRALCAAS